jgi:hypothetical protein
MRYKKDITASMPAFKNPGFQERQEAAARARDAALAKYRARPPIDEATTAERKARSEAREAAQAAKREEMRRAKEEAAQAKLERERAAVAAAEAEAKARAEAAAQAKADTTARKKAERMLWTEEDRKAARDARYAARKSRQGRR